MFNSRIHFKSCKSNRSKPVVLTQDLTQRYSHSPTDFTNAPMSPAPHKSFHGSAPRRDVAAMRAICPPPAKRVVENKEWKMAAKVVRAHVRLSKLKDSYLDNSTNFTQSPWLHLPPAHQPKLQPQSATVSELSINRFHQGWIFKQKPRPAGNAGTQLTEASFLDASLMSITWKLQMSGDKNWAACGSIHPM